MNRNENKTLVVPGGGEDDEVKKWTHPDEGDRPCDVEIARNAIYAELRQECDYCLNRSGNGIKI